MAAVSPITKNNTVRNTFLLVKKAGRKGTKKSSVFSKKINGEWYKNRNVSNNDFRFRISVMTFKSKAVPVKIPNNFHKRFMALSVYPFCSAGYDHKLSECVSVLVTSTWIFAYRIYNFSHSNTKSDKSTCYFSIKDILPDLNFFILSHIMRFMCLSIQKAHRSIL